MRHSKEWFGWFFLMACFFFAGNAHADLIPPDVTACEKKAAGDSCTADGKTGTCQQSKCTKLDYSDGTPPTSKEYDCTKCVSGTPQEAAPADGSTKEATPPKTGGCDAFSWPGSSNASFFLACFILFGIWLTRRSQRNA